jgi:hypothetical protein|nr:MAG TPA_asm: hypothetical protein [Caudoviricetes sp.]
MPEYIEKDRVIEWFRPYGHTEDGIPYYGLVTDIREMAAADVEQVTRCKDCFQSVVIGEVLHCTYWNKDTDENGYCHEGG